MKVFILFLTTILFISYTAHSQIHQQRYKPDGLYKGNFGQYPSRLRVAPIFSFGSSSVNFQKADSFNVKDTTFIDKLINDPIYRFMGGDYKSGSQVSFGLMFDYPFGRNVVFRPSISYSSRSVKDTRNSKYEDTLSDNKWEWDINNVQKLSQLQTMFMLNAQFGSDKQNFRFFVGAGFGFAVNLKSQVDIDYHYLRTSLTNPNNVYDKIDTVTSVNPSIGPNPDQDFFTKMDLQAQAELGVEYGNFLFSMHYNGSLGSIMTDPRYGTYVPYSVGVSLAYILGQKPDLWNR